SAQLQSSHGATQLNLGNLSHPKASAESDGRGEGFELRTDQWGAVRAGEGLLISTHPQAQAEGNHLDTSEAKSQIEGSLNNAQALSEVAKNQQTNPLEVLDNLKNFLEQIEQQDENKAAAFKQALMILSAPNSIALSSQQDVHLSADGQISHSAGESINLSTQQSLIAHASQKLSLFAAQDGARLYAGKGKVEIQAQGDGADLIARKGVQIISTEDRIEVKASKKIILVAGGSQIEISGLGVLPTTAGKFEVKAGQHLFMNGANVNTQLAKMPETGIFSRRFDFKDLISQELLAGGFKYKVINKDKKTEFIGTLDQNARTERIFSDNPDNIEILLLGKSDNDSDKLLLIEKEVDHNKTEGPDEVCCGEYDEDNYDKNTENLNEDNDLEADFKSFGI
ncbi:MULTISPECIES: type VI secretion system Vgr family protein, partial [unclassified Acinetobacter]